MQLPRERSTSPSFMESRKLSNNPFRQTTYDGHQIIDCDFTRTRNRDEVVSNEIKLLNYSNFQHCSLSHNLEDVARDIFESKEHNKKRHQDMGELSKEQKGKLAHIEGKFFGSEEVMHIILNEFYKNP
jgi:hypothetical protein